jgi:hypothetical protein
VSRNVINLVILVPVVVCPASAQQSQTLQMAPVTRPEQVLMNADVQKELGLDDEQRAKLTVLLAPYMKAHKIAMQGSPTTFAQMSEQEQREHREVMRNPLPEKRLREVLDDKQYRRMEEILFQAMGYTAISHPKVAAQLQLTNEQKTKINSVRVAVWKDIGPRYRDPLTGLVRPPLDGIEIQRELLRRALLVLTDEQRGKWTKILGKPFDVEPILRANIRD